MVAKRIRRFATALLTGTAVLLGLLALALLARTSQDSEQFGRFNDLLLLVNGAAAVVLLLLITGSVVRLVRDYRGRVPGARLKARMMTAFVGLVVPPLIIVWLFAVQFLNQGIDSWFDVQVESGLNDALELSRTALDVQMRDNLNDTRRMVREVAGKNANDLISTLGSVRRTSGALEVTVYGDGSRIVATSTGDPAALFPAPLPDDVILRVRQTGAYVGLDPAVRDSLQIRAAIQLPLLTPGGEARILQATFPVAGRFSTLAGAVERSYTRYSELVFLRGPLRFSFTITLTLVVLLSCLAAVYAAFLFARRIVAPLLSLVAGTRAVAGGDLDTRLPVASHDEIGFLIGSFNEMTRRLAEARETATLNAQQVERERARLAAILARLSTGVVATESDGSIRIANEAAAAILGCDLADRAGQRLEDLARPRSMLAQFVAALAVHDQTSNREWREQMTLRAETGRRILVCASTELPSERGDGTGRVLVFDDVTALLQAQRDAAWGEVARRLAHEIKNPLTPIQLSAERIRRRYLPSMQDMEAEVLDRATHTIVQQVEAMRDMVNAFSEYARAPELSISEVDLNQLVREVAFLYQHREPQATIAVDLDLDAGLQPVAVDAVRIRQLLHNLIRNAMEALEGRPGACMGVHTRREQDDEAVLLEVTDNGPGFNPDQLDRVFEPYVTTKIKGTGLGLAIVKKLVEEHGGSVVAENLPDGGACVRVWLPVRQEGRDGMGDARDRNNELRREHA